MSLRPLLGEYVDQDEEKLSLRRKVQHLESTVADLRESLQVSQEQGGASLRALKTLREQLGGLYNALRLVFGELDSVDVPETLSANVPPRVTAVWEQWKRKLGGKTAEVIQAILDHGTLSRQQLRAAAGGGWSTIDAAVGKLSSLGLLEKNGGKYSLKQL